MDAETKSPNKPALYKALGVLLVVAGCFFILPSIYEIQQAQQAKNWVPRTARVIHSQLSQFGGGRAHDVPHYSIDMKGVFLDTHEEFMVERISFGTFNDANEIRRIVNQYPRDSEITVFSAPNDASRVVLFKDVNVRSMYLMIALGVVCFLLGVVSFLKGNKLGSIIPIKGQSS